MRQTLILVSLACLMNGCQMLGLQSRTATGPDARPDLTTHTLELTLAPSGSPSFAQAYSDLESDPADHFITTDAAFDTTLRFFSGVTRTVEHRTLHHRLAELVAALDDAARRELNAAPEDHDARSAAALVAGYAAVARALVEGETTATTHELPPGLADSVVQETGLVMAHEGFAFSPLFGHKEDYSQYAVRGHYVRTELAERYFRTSMWLGRRMFRVNELRPDGAGHPLDRPPIFDWHAHDDGLSTEALHEVRAGLLLTHIVRGDERTRTAYRAYTDVTRRLFGPADDLTPEDLDRAARRARIRPSEWATASRPHLGTAARLAAEQARRRTLIDSTGLGRSGLVLLGRHTTVDSWVLQNMVDREGAALPFYGPENAQPFTLAHDEQRGPIRGFPTGLDIIGVLGSSEALDILYATMDAYYKGYAATLGRLRKQMQDGEWGPHAEAAEGTPGFAVLQAIAELYDRPPSDAPPYLRMPAWERKQVLTGLGAWTSLRYTNLLYAKQSYTGVAKSLTFPIGKQVMVEAVPEAFGRLRGAVEELREGLGAERTYPAELDGNFAALETWLADLERGARAGLEGRYVEGELFDRLQFPAESIEAILKWPEEPAAAIGGGPELETPLAVDVHTRAPLVVQEALGRPWLLTLDMEVGGTTATLKGATFSHYEFKQPMAERLDDAAWLERLEAGPPAAHWWLGEPAGPMP